MDDFILILKTKADCISIKKKIEIFIKEKLDIELNDKSRYYPCKMGVNFCGYRIFPTHRLLRTSSKKKIKRKIKKWNQQYAKNILDYTYTLQSINSWLGHCSHCNSYLLKQKILQSCDFLLSAHSYQEIEKNILFDMSHYESIESDCFPSI